MDYTFGFDKSLVDTYGAKVAVFDAIKGSFGNDSEITMHPYVKVPVDRDTKDAAREALSTHKGRYFVVRSGSRYEMMPGTSGMNDSERFVPAGNLMGAIEKARKPGRLYKSFVKRHDLEAEDAFPVCIQPMVAESFGFVSRHPNRDLIMADYLKGNDNNDSFNAPSSFSLGFGFDDTMANLDKVMSQYIKAGSEKPFAFYENGKVVSSEFGDHESMLGMAKDVFAGLSTFAEGFTPGYAWVMEYGPNPATGKPVVYQLKPLKKIETVKGRLKKSDADMAFGICSNLRLPVAEFYHPIMQRSLLESEYGDDLEIRGLVMNLNFVYHSGMKERDVLVRDVMDAYRHKFSEKIRERYGSDVCLSYQLYKDDGSEPDFSAFNPKAVVVSDRFRAGMHHNRTNLIQEVPVVLFGVDGIEAGGDIVINSDGVNATVRKA